MIRLYFTPAMATLDFDAHTTTCSAAVQPLFGQLCNIFGRRWVMIAGTALFTLGSGICGGASNGGMLIAGRAIQGAGSGGAVMLCSK